MMLAKYLIFNYKSAFFCFEIFLRMNYEIYRIFFAYCKGRPG